MEPALVLGMERRRAGGHDTIPYRPTNSCTGGSRSETRSLKRREPKAKARFPVGGRVWRMMGRGAEERSGKTFDRGAGFLVCGCGET